MYPSVGTRYLLLDTRYGWLKGNVATVNDYLAGDVIELRVGNEAIQVPLGDFRKHFRAVSPIQHVAYEVFRTAWDKMTAMERVRWICRATMCDEQYAGVYADVAFQSLSVDQRCLLVSYALKVRVQHE